MEAKIKMAKKSQDPFYVHKVRTFFIFLDSFCRRHRESEKCRKKGTKIENLWKLFE